MQFDLSKFKKIAADKNSTTLQNPAGHQIRIAHDSVTGRVRNQLHSLPMYLPDGGDVVEGNPDVNQYPDETFPGGKIMEGETAPAKIFNNMNPAQQDILSQEGSSMNNNHSQAPGEFQQSPLERMSDDEFLNSYDPKNPEHEGERTRRLELNDKILDNLQYNKALRETKGIYGKPKITPQALPNSNVHPDIAESDQAPASEDQGRSPAGVPGGGNVPPPLPGGQQMDVMAPYNRARSELMTGAAQQGQAERQQAAGSLPIEQDLQGDLEEVGKNAYALRTPIYQEMQNVIKDTPSHIRPDHYLENMGTPKKIATAIGLLAGGMGSAFTGSNPALDFLNKQIDRDIESQKANIALKPTLLGAYAHMLGSVEAGTKMAMATNYGIYASRLREQALKVTDLQTRARLNNLAAQFDEKTAPLINEVAFRTAVFNQLQKTENPASRIRLMGMAGMMSPEQQATASKELAENENLNETKNMALNQFDHINGMAGKGSFSPHDRESAINSIAGKIQVMTEHRYNEDAVKKMVSSVFPELGDLGKTAGNKRVRLINLFDTMSHHGTLEQFGLKGNVNKQPIRTGPPVRPAGM